MQSLSRKQLLIIVFVFALVAGLVFLAVDSKRVETPDESVSTTTQQEKEVGSSTSTKLVIGQSVEGRDIEVYTYGSGNTHLLFVGGIHGGYEWNSVVLAYNFIDYFGENPDSIPENIKVSIIPSANPDGVYEVVGAEGRFSKSDVPLEESKGYARFNANEVDLNRNFDCNWRPTSTWRGQTVDAGSEPFSEPEARAIRDFVMNNEIEGAVFWHSQANAVYGSQCNEGILSRTLDIMNRYAKAANYRAVESFDAYPITGDAEGWLASLGIPAVSVELSSHETVEWERNLRGVEALLNYYSSTSE